MQLKAVTKLHSQIYIHPFPVWPNRNFKKERKKRKNCKSFKHFWQTHEYITKYKT